MIAFYFQKIHYVRIYTKTTIMALSNPFEFIAETSMFPHARTRRTSFSNKITDTWRVIAGKRRWGIKALKPGLIDFAGLMVEAELAKMLWRLGAITLKAKDLRLMFTYGALTGFVAAITLPLTVVRMAAALAATLAALPIVGFVHLIARGIDASRPDSLGQAEAVEGSLVNPDSLYMRMSNTVPLTLREYLSRRCDIEQARADIRISEKNPSQYILVLNGNEADVKFYIKCTTESLASNPGLRALFTHNIGGLTNVVEQNSSAFLPLADALTAEPTGTRP